jgi:hypothetical protein
MPYNFFKKNKSEQKFCLDNNVLHFLSFQTIYILSYI